MLATFTTTGTNVALQAGSATNYVTIDQNGNLATSNTTATLFNTTATTLSLGGAATTALNIGNGASAYTAINIGSGNGGNTINLGTGTGVDTIRIGTGGTGADVWSLLVEARTLAELVGMLAEHYAGDADVIAADVRTLLDTLVGKQLVLRTTPERGRTQ